MILAISVLAVLTRVLLMIALFGSVITGNEVLISFASLVVITFTIVFVEIRVKLLER